jgi:hypothetical protein
MVYEFTVTFTPAPGTVTRLGGPDSGYVVTLSPAAAASATSQTAIKSSTPVPVSTGIASGTTAPQRLVVGVPEQFGVYIVTVMVTPPVVPPPTPPPVQPPAPIPDSGYLVTVN